VYQIFILFLLHVAFSLCGNRQGKQFILSGPDTLRKLDGMDISVRKPSGKTRQDNMFCRTGKFIFSVDLSLLGFACREAARNIFSDGFSLFS